MSLRHVVSVGVFSILLTGCPQVPTTGTLPKLDGSQLTNLTVDKVGSSSAADVDAGAKAIAAATDAATPSTIVKRDAAGAFAGTLTGGASFATGHAGSQVTAASSLVLPGDGDYYALAGGTAVDGIASKDEGTRVMFRVRDGLTFHHNATSLALVGAADFRASAGDVLQFVSTGAGNWTEVLRRPSRVTRLAALGATSVVVSGGAQQAVSYGATSLSDSLTEYNSSSGVFTAFQGGTYAIEASLVFSAAGWTSTDYCDMSITFSLSTIFSRGVPRVDAGATECIMRTGVTLTFPPGGQATVSVSPSRAATISNTPSVTYLRITRVGD